MSAPIHVAVTAEHIANGQSVNCFGCPIALAVKDAKHREWISYSVAVCSKYINIDNVHYKMSDECVTFMMMFDKGKKVSPFSFDLIPLNS